MAGVEYASKQHGVAKPRSGPCKSLATDVQGSPLVVEGWGGVAPKRFPTRNPVKTGPLFKPSYVVQWWRELSAWHGQTALWAGQDRGRGLWDSPQWHRQDVWGSPGRILPEESGIRN